jgi:nitroimidazol reductase NimA-like FMN-containing flavoprotein (pyridoxamine 5'-phosphate oxidase superfamily)
MENPVTEPKAPSNRTTPIHGMRGAKRWAYIERQRTIRIATVNDDGSIYLSPIWYVVQNQTIYLPFDAGSKHASNVKARGHLTGVIDSGDEFATVHGVTIKGTLRPVEDSAIVEKIMGLIFNKYFYDGHPYAESYFQFGKAAGRGITELVAQKFGGWDMRETSLPQVPEARVLPSFLKDRLL